MCSQPPLQLGCRRVPRIPHRAFEGETRWWRLHQPPMHREQCGVHCQPEHVGSGSGEPGTQWGARGLRAEAAPWPAVRPPPRPRRPGVSPPPSVHACLGFYCLSLSALCAQGTVRQCICLFSHVSVSPLVPGTMHPSRQCHIIHSGSHPIAEVFSILR